MYGKAFCVLIIALIIIYYLATGSAETVASSNNESLTSWATYGTLVQAGAAVITLGIMVWLGIRQNKLTQRQNELMQKQVNLVLYETRYEIYLQTIKLLDVISHYTQLPTKKSVLPMEQNTRLKDMKQYIEEVGKLFCDYEKETSKKEFLFNEDVLDYIKYIKKDVEIFESLVIQKINDIPTEELPPLVLDTDIFNKLVGLEREINIAKKVFMPYLDFKNI